MTLNKVGIFGGSFNPPHLKHYEIAEYIINNNIVDHIIFVPTGNKYPKPGLISATHRYQMLQSVIKHEKMSISDFEIKSSCVYTYQTLDHFSNQYPEANIYFIMGADNYVDLPNWHQYEKMIANFNFIVLPRKGFEVNDERVIFLKHDYNQISSSYIREHIINNNSDIISKYVHNETLEYINKHNLYKG